MSPWEQQGEPSRGQPQPPAARAPQHSGSPSISHHRQLRRPKGTLAIKAAHRGTQHPTHLNSPSGAGTCTALHHSVPTASKTPRALGTGGHGDKEAQGQGSSTSTARSWGSALLSAPLSLGHTSPPRRRHWCGQLCLPAGQIALQIQGRDFKDKTFRIFGYSEVSPQAWGTQTELRAVGWGHADPAPRATSALVPGTAPLRWAHAAGSQPCSQGRQPDFKYMLNYSSRYSACWRHRVLDTGSLLGRALTSLPRATATSRSEVEGSSRGRPPGLCPLHRHPTAHSSGTPSCQISLLFLSAAPCFRLHRTTWLHIKHSCSLYMNKGRQCSPILPQASAPVPTAAGGGRGSAGGAELPSLLLP